MPGESTLAVERDGVIDLVDLESGIVERRWCPGRRHPIRRRAGRSIARLPRPGRRQVHVVSLDSDTPLETFSHLAPIIAHFSPDGRSVAIGGNDDAVTILDLESGRTIELAGMGPVENPHLHLRRPAGDERAKVAPGCGTSRQKVSRNWATSGRRGPGFDSRLPARHD